jgi:hypothetical protein
MQKCTTDFMHQECQLAEPDDPNPTRREFSRVVFATEFTKVTEFVPRVRL